MEGHHEKTRLFVNQNIKNVLINKWVFAVLYPLNTTIYVDDYKLAMDACRYVETVGTTGPLHIGINNIVLTSSSVLLYTSPVDYTLH